MNERKLTSTQPAHSPLPVRSDYFKRQKAIGVLLGLRQINNYTTIIEFADIHDQDIRYGALDSPVNMRLALGFRPPIPGVTEYYLDVIHERNNAANPPSLIDEPNGVIHVSVEGKRSKIVSKFSRWINHHSYR